MANQKVTLAIIISAVVLVAVGAYLYFNKPSLPTLIDTKPVEVVQTEEEDDGISLADLNDQGAPFAQEINLSIKLHSTQSGASLKSVDGQKVFGLNADTIFITVFIDDLVQADSVAVVLESERTKTKVGPVVAKVKVENGVKYAVVKVSRSNQPWVPGPYRVDAHLPDGITFSEFFNIE